MDDWKPIESAPKDGTPLDVWIERLNLKKNVSGSREVGVYWRPDEKDEPTFAGGKWMMPSTGLCDSYPAESATSRVTHWMPLPQPPKTKE